MAKNFRTTPGQNSIQNDATQKMLQQAILQQALVHHQKGELTQAQALYQSLLKLQPKHFDGLHLYGVLTYQMNQHSTAVRLISDAIRVNPTVAAPYSNLGLALQALGRLDEALSKYDKAIELKPDYFEAHNNRGATLRALQRLGEALTSCDKAIALKPSFAEAHNTRGNTLKDLMRLEEALISYEKAIEFKPNYAEAYSNRGNALRELTRLEEALTSCEKATDLKPEYAEAHNNCGLILSELKRYNEALISSEKAIALKPDYAEAHNTRGNILRTLNRLDEALLSYNKAISHAADFVEAHNNRGLILSQLEQSEEALLSYDKAIALKPDFAEAHGNRGKALSALDRPAEALASYEIALELKPDYEFLLGSLLHTKTTLCDWESLNEQLEAGIAAISDRKKVMTPFPALSLLDSPELHQQISQLYTETFYPKNEQLGPIPKHTPGEKIRLAYYSADFRNHAVSLLTAELFEIHDRKKFEVYGFAFGPNTNDEMHARVSAAFDNFIDARNVADIDVAKLSREMGIDIAVDLGGFTQNARPGIFAARCAPIQVNYLGYPGTMGADYFDYVIADRIVLPPGGPSHFTEKAVYLPHSFQVNDSKRIISERTFTKQELDLPERGFVFCCFNNNYKILPSIFDVWMRILKKVDDSVLWLFEDNPTAVKNLRKEAEIRGVDGNRLIFAKRIAYGDYLARYKCADLFLDTRPYNAGTTASDALWTGLPVLTYIGKSFASRMAASLLNAIELAELIANTEAEYEAKAIALASNPEKLANIKHTLNENRLRAPLFNTRLFAKHIEAAYEMMHEKYQAGLPPENIEVTAYTTA